MRSTTRFDYPVARRRRELFHRVQCDIGQTGIINETNLIFMHLERFNWFPTMDIKLHVAKAGNGKKTDFILTPLE